MHRRIVKRLVFALLSMAPHFFIMQCEALNIVADPVQLRFTLTGQIIAGDADRFLEVILPTVATDFLADVAIASNGGDITEAMRIATIVRGLHFSVRIHQGGVCASACFIVYLAGEPREYIDSTRDANSFKALIGRIGLHRPYFPAKLINGADQPKMLERQRMEMLRVADYMRQENVPESLIDKMMTRASSEIYWMTQEELVDLGNYGPAMQELLIAQCSYRTDRQENAWNDWWRQQNSKIQAEEMRKFRERSKCIARVHSSFDTNAFVEKLKSGWRPWKK